MARHLRRLAPDLVERNPSLYAIAGQLDKLLYTFDGTPGGAGLGSLSSPAVNYRGSEWQVY
jgi:hypothetical protein